MAKFGITLLILGLTVGAIGFLATDQIQQQVQDGVNEDLSNVAEQEAANFENWHERNQLVTRNLAGSQEASTGSPSQMQDLIDERMDNRESGESSVPDVASIHYVDVDDNRVDASSNEGLQESDLSAVEDRPWSEFLAGSETAPPSLQVMDAYTINGSPRLAYVLQAGGQDSKAVVYVVNVSQYQSSGQTTDGRITYVVSVGSMTSSDNTIIFDSAGQAEQGNYPYTEPVNDAQELNSGGSVEGPFVAEVGELIDPVSGSAPGEFRTEPYVVSYAPVEDTNYAVMVHTPTSEAYGFVTQVSQFGFLATLAGVLTIGLVGAILGRNTATAIDRLRKKTEEMEQGNLDVEFETKRVDNIGRLYDGLASMRDALRRQITEAREAREEAELAREEAEQTSRHLQAKANEYRDVMQACAAGDLSRRMQPSQRNEAMQEIAQEFNAMIAELEQTVQQLKDFANEVATSSEEVTASAEEVRSASQQVTRSIQEISEGAERQNDSLQSVSREMSGLSTTVEEIASLSNEVADLAERTAKTGRRGREAAQEAIAGMNQIETESEQAVEQITELDQEMQQIDELIEFITDVADQTNMLALNANIEAARSSDSGEGFAVVANEVKELAEETKQAAEDIEQRLERIQGQTEDTVDSVQTTGERIAENTESVRNAVEALDEIAGYAQETNTGVQEISAATEEQAASTEEVVAMVDEAATISERTSGEAENVAAAAEEQTTAMTEVSDSASELSQQASRLSEALDRFSTQAEGEIAPSGEETAATGTAGAPDFEPAPGTEPEPEPEMEEIASEDLPAGVEELAEEFDDEAIDVSETDAEAGTPEAGEGGSVDFEPPGEAEASAPEPEPEGTDDLPPGAEGEEELGVETETEAAGEDMEVPTGIDDLAEGPADDAAGESGDATPPEPSPEEAIDDLAEGPADDGAPPEPSPEETIDDIAEEPTGDLPEESDDDDLAGDEALSADFDEGDLEAPEVDEPAAGEPEATEEPDSDGPAEAPAGVGDLAGDDLSLDDAAPGGGDGATDTLGGTEPATFGDDPGDDEDVPEAGQEDDMFSFVEGEEDQKQSEEGDD